jgi:hypothetical protein
MSVRRGTAALVVVALVASACGGSARGSLSGSDATANGTLRGSGGGGGAAGDDSGFGDGWDGIDARSSSAHSGGDGERGCCQRPVWSGSLVVSPVSRCSGGGLGVRDGARARPLAHHDRRRAGSPGLVDVAGRRVRACVPVFRAGPTAPARNVGERALTRNDGTAQQWDDRRGPGVHTTITRRASRGPDTPCRHRRRVWCHLNHDHKARPNDSTRRSLTIAGDPASPATCTSATTASAKTSPDTSTSTTPTAPTTAVSPKAASPPISSIPHRRSHPEHEPHPSPQLGESPN